MCLSERHGSGTAMCSFKATSRLLGVVCAKWRIAGYGTESKFHEAQRRGVETSGESFEGVFFRGVQRMQRVATA